MEATAFLTFVVTSLLTEERRFEIDEKHDELGTLLTLTVASEDMGVIIGKNGRTVEALRTVLRVFGSKHNERVNLRLVEKGVQLP